MLSQKFLRPIALRQHLRHNQRHAAASLVAAASITAAVLSSNDTKSEQNDRRLLPYGSATPITQTCQCERNDRTAPIPSATKQPIKPKPPLSRLTLLLYNSKLYPHSYLRVPRLLTPRDPLFSYPELKRGLLHRHNDEEKVKQILSSTEVMEARKNGDQAQLGKILQQMNSVVYGDGITPQIREDFLAKYGCTGFTDDILQYLVDEFGQRGIVEVGAGNGQWARALSDHYRALNNSDGPSKSWNFILAYDNMKQLPLSPKVYHKNTLPANKYFFDVKRCASHIDAVQSSRGRALLLVYPPPGTMAIETVQAYVGASPGYHNASHTNDTIVYVGEGRGGANANDAFFDYFLGCNDSNNEDTQKDQWVLEKVMNVQSSPGGKGYEKMFVFRRKSTL